MRVRSAFVALMVLMTSFVSTVDSTAAAEKLRLLWSVYVGWMPWGYAAETGILAKHAAKHGVGEIDAKLMKYTPSLEAYGMTKDGQVVVSTNMDLMATAFPNRFPSTVVIVGDYSNDNDQILSRDPAIKTIADLKGKTVHLVPLSVSHYLLVRLLEKAGLKESDVVIAAVQDENELEPGIKTKEMTTIVTWNPFVLHALEDPAVHRVGGSADIPGEIQDLCVVATDKTTPPNDGLPKALTGAWYEVLGQMTARGPVSQKALAAMADASGSSVKEFEAQLKTTAMFWEPAKAAAYMRSGEFKANNDRVRRFCAEHNMLGEGVTSPDAFGIRYPDGSIQGDPKNVLITFDPQWMDLAAKGQLK